MNINQNVCATVSSATIRFYEELNDFLPLQKRKHDITITFRQRNSIKDLIESLGIPHTEIDLILVNQTPVDFSYIVRDQDRISVYPVFESFDISSLNRLRPQPLRYLRFVLDIHLGKLAKYLRMLGFDTLYANHYSDTELATLASSGEKRILLTRDVGLLKHKLVSHGYFVRTTQPRQQLVEIVERFDLKKLVTPFKRCVHCNGCLTPLEKPAAQGRVPAQIYQDLDKFVLCDSCQQIYWQGSHYDRMMKFIRFLLNP
ncbi:MAG: Twitching motility protein PilT [Gammaproteobacteria bacterium]|nr:Twitching motility protein PilT [Gammaproteobacteria bacterium]